MSENAKDGVVENTYRVTEDPLLSQVEKLFDKYRSIFLHLSDDVSFSLIESPAVRQFSQSLVQDWYG